MAKITVEAAAKRLGMEPEECLKRLQEMGLMVRDQLDKIDSDVFQKVKLQLEDEKMRAKAAAASTSKRIGSKIIRRRRIKDEAEGGTEEELMAETAAAAEVATEQPQEIPAVPPAEDLPVVEDAAASAREETVTTEVAAPESEMPEPAAPEFPAEETALQSEVEEPAATGEIEESAEEAVAETESPASTEAVEAAPAESGKPARGKKKTVVEDLRPKRLKLYEVTREPAKIISKPVVPLETLKPAAGAKPAPGAKPASGEAAPAGETKPPTDADKRERKGRRVVDFGERDRRKEEDREIGFLRNRRQKKKKAVQKTEITVPKAIKRKIRVGDQIQVGELGKRMGVKSGDLIRKLIGLGMLVTINQNIDFDTASIVANELGFEVEKSTVQEDDIFKTVETIPENLRSRPPVVTVMGHVDHGKTTLLDAIRSTHVADGEAGGITQHMGSYSVRLPDDRLVTFVDTPGHESFAAMRARGAKVTDIVILVVAADDGVMPQTIESISHAKDAEVPIVVAVNKIDKENASPEKITRQLMEYGLVPEQLGGDTLFVNISAKKKIGIEELLEAVLLQAEMMQLTADPAKAPLAIILDARLERGLGPVVDVIVREGTLRKSDFMVADVFFGRIRMMLDDKGQQLDEVGPGMPAQIIGFNGIPRAGMVLNVVPEEKTAKALVNLRVEKGRAEEQKKRVGIRLEDLYAKVQEGEIKELKVVVKCDVHGSLEAVRDSVLRLGNEDIKVRVLHSGVGTITETDVNLASASEAIIIGFNVKPEAKTKELAETLGVEIKTYAIIYDLIQEVKAALEGMLEPTYEEVVNGVAEVRSTFNISRVGTIAGCYVLEGKIVRNSKARLFRKGELIHTGTLSGLKRFKDDAREVASGFECGIAIDGYQAYEAGDRIESFNLLEHKATL
ncbi:MAG: translation initiation factor IF-2 [Myxococcales bacterium]|nr:translation initiation factor IF-2 [Myxococcales bacterium]